jgi:hypothetical protein
MTKTRKKTRTKSMKDEGVTCFVESRGPSLQLAKVPLIQVENTAQKASRQHRNPLYSEVFTVKPDESSPLRPTHEGGIMLACRRTL